MSAPAIDTERLSLRVHQLADFDDCAAMWADGVVTRHLNDGLPFSRSQVWERLLRYAGLWSLLGYGLWAVRERASGRFVGDVGFMDLRREIDPPLDAPEIGWVLASSAHGKGYATEAVRAVLAWGETRFDGARTVCIVDPDNHASIQVAHKCGYRELRRATFHAKPIIVFERPSGAASK